LQGALGIAFVAQIVFHFAQSWLQGLANSQSHGGGQYVNDQQMQEP
jgi:hypothetical protein